LNREKVKKDVCQIEYCNKLTHKKSKYCIFHASAEEKTEKEFIAALKEYVDKIKEEDKDYDFKGFIFVGNIDFREDLSITVFKNAVFMKATFKGYAGFWEATFKGYAIFGGATFKRDAGFREATFEGDATFGLATFEGDADFGYVTFKGDAQFMKATFKGGADFGYVTFKGDANFLVKYFAKDVTFEKANLFPGKKLNLIAKKEGTVYFERTYLENVYLELYLSAGNLIDFTDALFRNTQIKKDQIENHILQEKKKEFSKAQKIYLLLKNNFHSIGQYEDESWAFKKEKNMERKSNCHFKTLHKWLWSCFLNAIYGYGERPFRVIVSAMVIIIIFAFVFMNFGIDANPQLDTIPKYNILKELFMGIRYGDLLVRLKDISLEQIKNCLYFSTVTFTTLGLGDFRPVEGWGRIFVGTEAFIGALMMALFIYTFARRTGGR